MHPTRPVRPAPTGPRRERREPGEIFGPGFTLFADMLLVGVVTGLACLPVVTLPAAFAAASATLRESVREGTPVRLATFGLRLRARLTPGALAAGLVPPALAVLVLTDGALADAGLPGAAVVAPALYALTLFAAVVGLRATALETPWRLSVREAFAASLRDPRGTLLLAAAAALAALLAWAVPLLLPLLPGPLAFAATVADLRSAEGEHVG